ncbi:MAG: DUF3820 family protein [Elusimicrobia bacterium]|nr:DUF3820 family protein [Candidatus Liberimonas magnetica]
MNKAISDREYFIKLSKARMPFGKYTGTPLIDIPEAYIVWFIGKGFAKGELGDMLKIIYEAKVNGLEYLFGPVRAKKETQKNVF